MTIGGTAGDDVIVGGDDRDSIFGLDGNDTLSGNGNSDSIYGGAGQDTIDGGTGDDFLLGEDGDDVLSGGAGHDYVLGEAGNDTIDGGDGDDTLSAGGGSNLVHGGQGDDVVTAGQEVFWSQSGSNVLFGDLGNDTLQVINLGTVGAQLFGGEGDDILKVLAPNGDVINGGNGYDTLWVEGHFGVSDSQSFIFDLVINLATQTFTGNGQTLAFVSIESAIGGDGNDVIHGNAGANWIMGSGGDDLLDGGAGNDMIIGDLVTNRPQLNTLPGGGRGLFESDTVTYENTLSAVSASLSFYGQDSGLAVSVDGNDRLYQIENIIGTAFADTLIGSDDPLESLRDRFGPAFSPYGLNHLEGRGGNDTLSGLSGDDFLEGGDDDDVLDGGSGNDRLSGGAGDDTIQGGLGGDVLVVGEGGINLLDGGAGDDVASFDLLGGVDYDLSVGGQLGLGTDVWVSIEGMMGGDLRDRFWGDAAHNLLIGGGGDDDLFGRGGADDLYGGAGNDLLEGGDGDDVLDGGGGIDSLDGGAGSDFISFAKSVDGITIDLAANAWTDGVSSFAFVSIENVQGSAGADILRGDVGANRLLGGGGNDQLFGGGGDDWLDGQNGTSALRGEDGDDTLVAGTDLIADGGNGDDVVEVYGPMSLLIGGDGHDRLVFHYSYNSNTASISGFEVLEVANTFLAGAQLAQFTEIHVAEQFAAASADLSFLGAVNIDLSAKLDDRSIRVMGSNEADTIWLGGGDDELRGGFGDGDDTLHSGDGNDLLDGEQGNDTLEGGAGNDTLRGGDGFDTASYANATVGVTVDLTTNAQGTIGAGTDTLESIEALIGTAFDDQLTGDSFDNVLDGGAGNDVLWGGLGNDTLIGGSGNDTAIFQEGLTGFTVSLLLQGAAQDTGAGLDTLIGIENLRGSARSDVLIGDAGNNNLEGGGGNDTLDGDAGVDTANYSNSDFGVAVNLALSGPQNTGAGNDTLIGIENVTGSAFSDTLTGSAGNNVLEGALGNDTLDGGAGQDTASYAGSTQRVVVSLAVSVAQNTLGAGTDTLIAIENLTGSSFGDNLTGDAANNTLSGGAGVDTLIGGAGDDTLIGGDNTDFIVDLSGIVSIDGGAGNELITLGAGVVSGVVDGGLGADQVTKGGSIAGLTFVSVEILNTNGGIVTGSAAQFEGFDTIRFSAGQPSTAISLVLSQAGTVDLTDELLGRRVIFTGTAGNDTITTSNGSDNIDGGAGDDVLSGGLGVDTLIGGLGNDILNGGDGIDFIVDLSGIMAIDAGDGDDVMTVGAAVSSGTIAGGLGTDQLNKGGAINGIAITGIEIVNTNGGTLLATAAQLESFDTIRFSAALATTAVSLALADAGTVDLTDELLGRRALFAGTSGNDTISTSNGSDQIDGGDGDDVLTGNAGVDTLIGGLGNDTLNGGDGGDFIVDLSGVVAIDGGDGDDVITVGAAVSSGTIAGGLGTADQLNKGGAINGITITGIEIVNTNGGTLTATAAQLESFDTIRFSAALPTTRVNLALATAGTVDLTDELLGGRALITGSSGADVITTSDGADTLLGGDGNDTLNGGLGVDAVYGGFGDDLVIQGATEGRDYIDGGAGTDTYQLNGTAAAETFRIMTRAEALLAGITGLAGATEIVITRDGTNNASVIAELDNIEEISINTLLTTANNGNGTVDGGTNAGDTIIVLGNFTTTSLAYSTIHIAGSAANDTVDISGLSSAHRVVFDANGGSDAIIGEVRPQDVVTGIPGISANFLSAASIASDFQLMELVNQTSLSAASDGVDPFVLLQSAHEITPVDLASPADLIFSARDLLTGFDTKDLGSHQIAADYALLQL